jgi:dipeptidyl aminopeptidase/acylaminoacyl peptidase
VRLRDFGDLGTETSDGAMAVSPDGHTLAIQLRQGQPETNDYCTALVVVPVDGSDAPRAIADTGDIVPSTTALYGMDDMTLGAPQTEPVVWSPDGAWIAFVKTHADGADIWRIRPDGSGATLVYASLVPVDGLAWTPDGKRLVFASTPGLVEARRKIAEEGLSGFHYDARFWPLAGMTPHPLAASVPTVDQTIDLGSGAIVEAGPSDAALLAPVSGPPWPAGTRVGVTSARGDLTAWTVADHPGWVHAPLILHARGRGRDLTCADEACRDVTGLWLLRDQRSLLFLHRDGVARSRTSLYRWTPGQGRPRRLLGTDDAIFGCHQAGDELLCAHESSIRPRAVVRIDGRSGAIATLFDPNPEWRTLTLGHVERLTWRNGSGVETFGDLVLPLGYRPGMRVPLIVVQYESRGFLRGGTGDDYPIQLYAAHGFAVLSFNRPPFVALADGPKPVAEFGRLDQQGWADRRSVQSSLETIIGQLAALGIVDPARVGITGLSDGASTSTFALIHSHLFAAAAISTCCEDSGIMENLGEGFANAYAGLGYPRAGQEPANFWTATSLDLHSADRPIPILVQASDTEARMGLRTFSVLKNAGWPIDIYVFTGESHMKIQPAHRLALFERSLGWFERWLDVGRQAPVADNAHAQSSQPAAQASTSTH